ncbi:MAG: GNAT family N-acetyltransferase [Candidatus Eremiobacterota bacterium]
MLTLRRRDFQETDLTAVRAILSRARYGHLSTVSPEGEVELRPLNFVVLDHALYFHCAPATGLAARHGTRATFAAQDLAVWIPSTWRDAELACPATTFYRSVGVRGALELVEELDRKARVLDAFMRKYQPEGGHQPLDHERHRKPLQGLAVLALPLDDCVAKVKLGQHMSSSQKRAVYAGLVARGDLLAARAMRDKLDFPAAEGWVDDPAALDPVAIYGLLKETYWAHKRSQEVVAANLERALLNLAFVSGGDLQAYCRVGSVQPDSAWLFDVVVRPDLRGQGLGGRMIARMLEHPAVSRLRRLFLDTRDAMDFYRRFGFVELDRRDGRSLMLRSQEGRLPASAAAI